MKLFFMDKNFIWKEYTLTAPLELDMPDLGITEEIINPAKVILFNDDLHTFDEVIFQIMKAITCSYDKAELLTWEVHSRGKACVYDGDVTTCLGVSSVLEEISLHTQVEY
ncbi:MAG: Clp protease ClpS [Ignavibacteria bacterium]|nr:Clp protease ClpS [Ignavibacteria bacterium]